MTNWKPLPTTPQSRGGSDLPPIYKWAHAIGEAVEGELKAVREGKFGLLADLGNVTVPLRGYCQQGKMAEVMARLPIGTLVRIEFIGKKPNKDPRLHPSNIFEIYTQAPLGPTVAPPGPNIGPSTPTGNLETKLRVKLGVQPANELIAMLKRMFPSNYDVQLVEVAKQHGVESDEDDVPF